MDVSRNEESHVSVTTSLFMALVQRFSSTGDIYMVQYLLFWNAQCSVGNKLSGG